MRGAVTPPAKLGFTVFTTPLAFSLIATVLGLATTPTHAPQKQAEPKPPSFHRPHDEDTRLATQKPALEKFKFAPGKGFEVRSADNRYMLQTSLRVGFQYSLLHPNDGGQTTQAFEVRRFRLNFAGHVFGEHNKFLLQLAFAPRELDVRDGVVRATPVWDAYLNFDHLKSLTVRIGQYRPQYSRERLIQDINPLLIDRSLANAEFNLDRDIGFDIRSEDFLGLERLRYYAGVFMGEGRDVRVRSDFGFLYVARVDVLPFGLFDDYESSDQQRSMKFRASLGAAYAFHDNARRNRGVLGDVPTDGGTTDYHNATADLLLKWAGWYVEAGFLWRDGTRSAGRAVDDMGVPLPVEGARNGLGWFAQTAYLLPEIRLEPALRYSQVRAIGEASSLTDRAEVGCGLNYYFFGHALKAQFDYFRLYDRSAIGTGIDQIRLQLQAAF